MFGGVKNYMYLCIIKQKKERKLIMSIKEKRAGWLEMGLEYINKKDDYFEELLCNQFDGNYYNEGLTLNFGNIKVEVESIWTDKDNHVYLHVCSPMFEGDVKMSSISLHNQRKVVKMLKEYNDKNY